MSFLGDLKVSGEKELFGIGQRYKTYFPSIFGSYSPKQMNFQTTVVCSPQQPPRPRACASRAFFVQAAVVSKKNGVWGCQRPFLIIDQI